jgi:FkbM family methyltransferase
MTLPSTRVVAPADALALRALGLTFDGQAVAPRGVIHVGGHHGEEAAYYAERGVETVVWIEAEPDAFEVLASVTSAFPGQHCIQALAADRDGEERVFYRHRFGAGAKRGFCSTLPWNEAVVTGDPILSRLETFDVRRVRAITVATALRERGFTPGQFQYLSVNVQGAELLVLRGLGDFLAPLRYVFCDGEDPGNVRYAGAPTIAEVEQWLTPHGFRPMFSGSPRQQFFLRDA